MSEIAHTTHSKEHEATTLPSKENPLYFGDSIEDQRITHFSVTEDVQAVGEFKGYYNNEEGKRVDIVSPLKAPDTLLEVIEGKVARSLAGEFLPNETVSVRRSDGSIDTDWLVAGALERDGVSKTIVYKDGVGEKAVSTEALRQLNPSDVVLPETTTEREVRLVAERQALGEAALRSVVAVPELAEAADIKAIVETEDQKLAREEREARTVLDELYRQYAQVDGRSDEAAKLKNEIEQAKDKVGKISRQRNRLRGF